MTGLRLFNLSHNPNLLSLPAELGTVTSLTCIKDIKAKVNLGQYCQGSVD